MTKGDWINGVVGALLGIGVWAYCGLFTSIPDPWDSIGIGYFVFLFVSGFLSTIPFRNRIYSGSIGIFVGQLLYVVAFFDLGPLFVLGIFQLALLTLIPLAGAYVANRVLTNGPAWGDFGGGTQEQGEDHTREQ